MYGIPTIKHALSKDSIQKIGSIGVDMLDIRKVVSMDVRKRLFCILNRTHPYELEIKYDIPTSKVTLSPVFTGGGMGFALTDKYSNTSEITMRYRTEWDAKQEMRAITTKQQQIKLYDEEINKKLMEFVNGLTKLP